MKEHTFAGRYVVGDNIGSGGMSELYACTDTLLGRQVALKVLRVELARDENFRERFRREAQNSSRLNHPNIVSVYDTGEEIIGGVAIPYIVMELVNGQTLRTIVRERGPYSPTAAAKLLIPVCNALQASHDAGIIHRDIKPANIMVTNTGEVKVMDFGIARALDDATSGMTQTSAVIGTAQYLSPEQARGKSADARSDVYALGCVLYEIITGRPPFEGESPFDVAYQHVHETPAPPSSHIPDLTPTAALNIDAVVLTAMAKHPDDRYASAADFASDLELISRNAVSHAAKMHVRHDAESIPAEDDHATAVFSPVTSAPTAHYAPTAASAGELDAGQGGDAVSSSGGSHRKQENKSRWGVWVTSILAVLVVAVGAAFVYDYASHGSGFSMRSVSIPQVSGKSESDATSTLRDAGFKVLRSDEPNPTVSRGLAIGTDPASGSELRKGSMVTLIVSSGKETVEVPKVTGMTTEKAFKTLEKAGLKLNPHPREEASDDVKEGKILEQSPAAGSQVSKGSEVTITISTGVRKETVPDLTGSTIAKVTERLESLGFKVQPEFVHGSEPDGTVLEIAGAGEEAEAGTTIVVRVSNGAERITMPDLSGLNLNQAIAALQRAGWKGNNSLITQNRLDTDDLGKQNTIASQEPAPGSEIGDKDPITVTLFKFNLSQLVP